MARYIDADKLLESVTKENWNDWLDHDIFQYLVEEAPAADVVPKSEVERLEKENEKLTINMNAYGLTAKRLAEENENLEIELENMRRNLGDAREGWNDAECEVERLRKALDEYEETSGLKQAKAEVAREIFEEIQTALEYEYMSYLKAYDYTLQTKVDELKKKYTGDQT